MGGNGSIVVVGGCFAKRGDAERIFRAADKSLFLRTVNQGSQADVLAFPQDACAFQGMKLMAAESQHVNERMPAAHVDGTGWKIAGGIDQQKAVMSFDNGADSGYILNRAGFRTGGFDTDKRAQRAVFLQDIMKIKRVYFADGIYFERCMAAAGFACRQHGFVRRWGIEDFISVIRPLFRYKSFDGQCIAG